MKTTLYPSGVSGWILTIQRKRKTSGGKIWKGFERQSPEPQAAEQQVFASEMARPDHLDNIS